VKKGDIVALKPNVVIGRVSKPGVITDKCIVEAMIRMCPEARESKILVVKGSDYFIPTDVALEKSGIKAAAEALGACAQKPWKRNFHKIGVVKAIVDLSSVVPVDLTVLDAINAMEGLGSSFGEIVPLNTVMASKDIWILDLAASRVMGLDRGTRLPQGGAKPRPIRSEESGGRGGAPARAQRRCPQRVPRHDPQRCLRSGADEDDV
jgi:uncharacterized protein (DUF362 family)